MLLSNLYKLHMHADAACLLCAFGACSPAGCIPKAPAEGESDRMWLEVRDLGPSCCGRIQERGPDPALPQETAPDPERGRAEGSLLTEDLEWTSPCFNLHYRERRASLASYGFTQRTGPRINLRQVYVAMKRTKCRHNLSVTN